MLKILILKTEPIIYAVSIFIISSYNKSENNHKLTFNIPSSFILMHLMIFFCFNWRRKYMIPSLLNQSFLVNFCDNRLISYRILNLIGCWLDSYDGKLVTEGKKIVIMILTILYYLFTIILHIIVDFHHYILCVIFLTKYQCCVTRPSHSSNQDTFSAKRKARYFFFFFYLSLQVLGPK